MFNEYSVYHRAVAFSNHHALALKLDPKEEMQKVGIFSLNLCGLGINPVLKW